MAAEVIVSILSIFGSIALGVRWLVKHYLSELKTNGGSSVKDQVNRLEQRMNEADQMRRETNDKIDKMYIILIDYIAGQNSKKRTKAKTDL